MVRGRRSARGRVPLACAGTSESALVARRIDVRRDARGAPSGSSERGAGPTRGRDVGSGARWHAHPSARGALRCTANVRWILPSPAGWPSAPEGNPSRWNAHPRRSSGAERRAPRGADLAPAGPTDTMRAPGIDRVDAEPLFPDRAPGLHPVRSCARNSPQRGRMQTFRAHSRTDDDPDRCTDVRAGSSQQASLVMSAPNISVGDQVQ